MGKWDFIIEPLLRDLESEIADGPGPIRSNIDDKIREAEQVVSETGPRDINERPEDRVAAFLRELRWTLRQRNHKTKYGTKPCYCSTSRGFAFKR